MLQGMLKIHCDFNGCYKKFSCLSFQLFSLYKIMSFYFANLGHPNGNKLCVVIYLQLCLVERIVYLFIIVVCQMDHWCGLTNFSIMHKDCHICVITIFSLKMLHSPTIFSYLNPIPQCGQTFFINSEMKCWWRYKIMT